MHLGLGLGGWVMSPHLPAPVEQEMPVADQPQLNLSLLIPEAENPEVQTQLEQHLQIQCQNQILNCGYRLVLLN